MMDSRILRTRVRAGPHSRLRARDSGTGMWDSAILRAEPQRGCVTTMDDDINTMSFTTLLSAQIAEW